MKSSEIWPHTIVTAITIAFCAFLIWLVPSAFGTAMLIVGGVIGWWFPQPPAPLRGKAGENDQRQ